MKHQLLVTKIYFLKTTNAVEQPTQQIVTIASTQVEHLNPLALFFLVFRLCRHWTITKRANSFEPFHSFSVPSSTDEGWRP